MLMIPPTTHYCKTHIAKRTYVCRTLLFFIPIRYWKERKMVKIDRNIDYNRYYTSQGERLDEGVCEAVDTNYYYGQ